MYEIDLRRVEQLIHAQVYGPRIVKPVVAGTVVNGELEPFLNKAVHGPHRFVYKPRGWEEDIRYWLAKADTQWIDLCLGEVSVAYGGVISGQISSGCWLERQFLFEKGGRVRFTIDFRPCMDGWWKAVECGYMPRENVVRALLDARHELLIDGLAWESVEALRVRRDLPAALGANDEDLLEARGQWGNEECPEAMAFKRGIVAMRAIYSEGRNTDEATDAFMAAAMDGIIFPATDWGRRQSNLGVANLRHSVRSDASRLAM